MKKYSNIQCILALLHVIAISKFPLFRYLLSDDMPDSNEITFKVMSDGGNNDEAIAKSISTWLDLNEINHTMNTHRCISVEGKAFATLLKMAKDAVISKTTVYYLEQYDDSES